jgi:hypothetical protein
MGRKAKFDVKSLEIGEKLPFPKNKRHWVWQYIRNFERANKPKKFGFVDNDGGLFIKRTA